MIGLKKTSDTTETVREPSCYAGEEDRVIERRTVVYEGAYPSDKQVFEFDTGVM